MEKKGKTGFFFGQKKNPAPKQPESAGKGNHSKSKKKRVFKHTLQGVNPRKQTPYQERKD